MVIIQHPQEPNENEPGRYERMVEFGGARDKGTGFMAHSDRVGPGIVLLHEWFGLQDSFKRFATRLSEEGFTVLAPDLYDGQLASNVEEAESLMQGLDQDKTARRVKAAAEFLRDNWHPRVGVVGFSLGAAYAADLAMEFPVEGTVMYYSTADPNISRWHGPLLLHFAENDDFEPQEAVDAYVGALEGAGVDHEAHTYPGVGHWFANAAVTSAYDDAAAELAFERTVEFFRYNLA